MSMEKEPNIKEVTIESILKEITEELLGETDLSKEEIENRINLLEQESLNRQKKGYEEAIREKVLTEEEVKKMIKEALMQKGDKRCAECKIIFGEKIGVTTTTDSLCQKCADKLYGEGFVNNE